MGKIIAICISEKRGTQKHEVDHAMLKQDFGIVGDAHAGNWHRQVSLLSVEKVNEFRNKGRYQKMNGMGRNFLWHFLLKRRMFCY